MRKNYVLKICGRKLFLWLVLLLFCQVAKAQDSSLPDVLQELEQAYKMYFSYNFEKAKTVLVDFEPQLDEPKDKAIHRLLTPIGWSYESFDGKYFVLFEKEISPITNPVYNQELRNQQPTKKIVETELSATVIDTTTLEPIVGAFIFFRNSSIGTVSDEEGYFQIDKGSFKQVELVITHLNYETQTIRLTPNEQLAFTIYLSPKNLTFQEIIVTSKRRNVKMRKQWMRRFQTAFFGKTRNSKGIKLENPEVVWFEEKDGLLTAEATDYLSITNKKLAYKMRFYLDSFQVDQEENILYAGKVFF